MGGPLTIEPRLGALRGLKQACMVTPLRPAPPAPQARPGMRMVELAIEGQPPFEILRRAAGAKTGADVGRTEDRRFIDESVRPGQAYQYSVRSVDVFAR